MQVIVLFEQHKKLNRISEFILTDRNNVVSTHKNLNPLYLLKHKFLPFPLTHFDGRQITRVYT